VVTPARLHVFCFRPRVRRVLGGVKIELRATARGVSAQLSRMANADWMRHHERTTGA
jgi:hypothetical protein